MIFVVYHIFAVGSWKELVRKQLNRIIDSGLYDNANQIWLTINLGHSTEDEIKDFLKDYDKVNFEIHTQNYAEYPGIKKVRSLAVENDAKIFYFHTKGVSNNWVTFNEKQPSIEKITNVNSWRECMEYFLMDRWEECVSLLDSNDNVGVSCNGGWYWGNFWWSKSEHIRKTREVELWNRWDYESWLNRDTPHSTNHEFYHIGFSPFLSNLLPEFYREEYNLYKGKKIVIVSAVYGTPPFEIDEGYNTMPLNIVDDVTDIVKKHLEEQGGYKLLFGVNNETMGGDPIFGHRKVMIVKFHPEGHEDKIYKLGITEGHGIDFEF